MKTHYAKLDQLFSSYIRDRADRQCENCGIYTDTIQPSHVFSRKNLATRWHPLGAFGDCNDCHRLSEVLGEKFWRRRLKNNYEKIRHMADSVWKPTPKEINELIIKYSICKITSNDSLN